VDEDATARSRRISRGRQLVLAGLAVVVLVLVGIGGVNVLRNDPGGPPPPAPAVAPGVIVPPAASGATQVVLPPDTPYLQVPPGTNPPEQWSPGTAAAAVDPAALGAPPGVAECGDPQDPALRSVVDQALPEVVGAPEAPTTTECRPGERGVAVEVDGGVLTVTYLSRRPIGRLEDGMRSAPTASGGMVLVSSRANRAGDPQPFADRLDALVAHLAARL
jgi:hypothetical protein